MKRYAFILAMLLTFNLSSFQALAAPVTYNFHPYDSSGQSWDINDLDHYKYYVWQITNFSLPQNQQIVGAKLTFTNIYDWQNESNDRLYIHLMDNNPLTSLTTIRSKTAVDADPGSSLKTYNTKLLQGTDNQQGGDNFGTYGTLITPVWSDPVGGLPANNVVYDFARLGGSISSTGNIIHGSTNILNILDAYLRNGNDFAFGIDPDCHYYNDQVTFTITTDTLPVPEPSTFALLGIAIAGLAILKRRTKTGLL